MAAFNVASNSYGCYPARSVDVLRYRFKDLDIGKDFDKDKDFNKSLDFDLKTAFPWNFVPPFFTNFCVIIATLLITVKLNATSMLGPENI